MERLHNVWLNLRASALRDRAILTAFTDRKPDFPPDFHELHANDVRAFARKRTVIAPCPLLRLQKWASAL